VRREAGLRLHHLGRVRTLCMEGDIARFCYSLDETAHLANLTVRTKLLDASKSGALCCLYMAAFCRGTPQLMEAQAKE
jgi:hypothetical protein